MSNRDNINEEELEAKQHELMELSKGISSLENYLKKSEKGGWQFRE